MSTYNLVMTKKLYEHLPPVLIENTKPEQLIKKIHSAESHLAAKITNFSGSMFFAYAHGVWFIGWIILNQGWLNPHILPFDPFPYGLLTMIVSLEAIFLSTFILVAQNRQALVDTYRELEDEKEQKEEDVQQEELEQDVEGIQKDMEDIQQDLDKLVKGMQYIQQKITIVEEKNRASGETKVKEDL